MKNMTTLFIILFILHTCKSFCPSTGILRRLPKKLNKLSLSSSLSGTQQTSQNDKCELIEKLHKLVRQKSESHNFNGQEEMKQVITRLEKEYVVTKTDDNDDSRFEPLIGYYNVSYVQSAKENDNPVGGKWTRNNNRIKRQLIHTRRTLQHILPVNTTGLMNREYKESAIAEAVNIISLNAFWKLIRLTVILRGDAISLSQEERNEIQKLAEDAKSRSIRPTLSNLAVRAYFDPPRIIIGKTGRFFNFQIGPPTSVVLDTSYVDKTIKIGVGGNSGTRFVFKKCSDNDDGAKEFFGLLRRRPVNRSTLIVLLGFLSGLGVRFITKGSVWSGGAITVMGLLATTAVAFSNGGVENDK